MGSKVTKPITDKFTVFQQGNAIRAGLCSMQGWRPEMEDEHLVFPSLYEFPALSCFAVFDGHGGGFTSKFLAANMIPFLLEAGLNPSMSVEEMQHLICDVFLGMDELLRSLSQKGGSTAVLIIVTQTHIVCANVGDSRAVLFSNQTVVALSEDHKPYNAEERKRITEANGVVSMKRINGDLAVSRSFGDFQFKGNKEIAVDAQLVIVVPDFIVHERADKDHFIVMACDGIWDILSSQEEYEADPVVIATKIVTSCFECGSQDNMSVLLILFPGAPSVDPEKALLRKEESLNKSKQSLRSS